MARSGILIHGLAKQMSFSWINRNDFLLLDTLKLNFSSIASALVSPTLIMGKESKQLKRQPETSTPLFRSSSRHSKGSLEDHSISQENPTRFVYSTVSPIKSLTQFIKGRYLPVFASEIIDRNQVALREGRPTINLKSILIGNGITDISTFVLHILISQRIHYNKIPQIIPRTL
jgi:Serine carboxypeptidase